MSPTRIEICKEFTFEAAHHLGANVPEGHPYSRLHGHSFKVEVSLAGTPNAKTGWIMDFAGLDAALKPLRERLDHRFLNEIEGLELPTLENITGWIWNELEGSIPLLHRVVVRRGSCGESCTRERVG